ncbi:DUF1329 domain-containing protein [Sinimarinibacterium sp. CAU 1509]|uniref:DUF1329 domain-containing protein n=1 Tax=Sinimarinibacterium sp. CAU 1509 TaxID=2562283 RepID=UPI0010AC50CC|nr:DUF1329 domain-containing protein [Sinimarinibacterium sp. CAU 1509]TJY63252.1 DUF1329 domain-containing protein [Sinimarinibacterium sp. CAU 1509]
MHIRRYDGGYSRRHFLGQMLRGVLATGVLMPLYKAMAASGDITKAYPDELLSLDAYTHGKIKSGDLITADNVDLVADLMEPAKLYQVRKLGRQLKVVPTTTDVMRLSPWEYLEATFRNKGRARFDARGNVVNDDGKPWIGGSPFPDPQSALEVFAGQTMSWGRHDASLYAFKEYDLDPDGSLAYRYEGAWAELSPIARVSMDPKPYWPGHEDKLRYQSIVFTAPNDFLGTSYLNIWDYDQNTFPELYGYIPAFKRIRQFPTDQRFEPLVPGGSLYLSDAWAAGDPLHTWGNYTIVGRGPLLAGISGGWNPGHPNWEHSTHGGKDGQMFWDTEVELVPETIIVDAEPVKFPRAPVAKKRVWFDARTLLPVAMVSYDRRGDVFRSFDGAYGLYEAGEKSVMDGAHPYWSWGHVHAFDVQTGRMTRLEQVKEVSGGHQMLVNNPDTYERYLTKNALTRLARS